MTTCVFCNDPIIKRRRVYEDDLVFAFPTNIPIVPGHMLLCPLRCVRSFSELSENEQRALFALLLRMKETLQDLYGAEGFNIAWNEGEVANQSVPHLHLHVLPRKAGDTGITEYDPRKFLYRPGPREPSPEAELQSVAEEVKAHLERL